MGYITAAIFFVPATLTTSLLLALPFLLVAGALIAAPNPPVDAARLDVVPSRMWGRAEAIRTFLRTLLQSLAPLIFGIVSQSFGGGHGNSGFGAGVDTKSAHIAAATTRGLAYTFLIMLVPLGASGFLLLAGRRTYAPDVAAAAVSEEETRRPISHPQPEEL